MKNIKDFDALSDVEKGNFIAHQAANLVQKMYYQHDKKGLEVFLSNLDIIAKHARNCVECLEILHQKGDVFAKIYLLLEYMGRNGINEEFVSGLQEITERANECLAMKDNPETNGHLDLLDNDVLNNLRSIIDRNENCALNN